MIPCQLEKRCQAIYKTLDHIELQPIEKINIRQNVRLSEHMPRLDGFLTFSGVQ